MEDVNARKRERVTSGSDSDSNSACPKRAREGRVDSAPILIRVDSGSESADCKRVEPEVEKIRHDILDILDDLDTVTDREPEVQDLDSVIKSFEEEIVQEPSALDSSELGYLLEASDDELGLPPAVSSENPPENQITNEITDINNFQSEPFNFPDSAEFENELPSYDPFEYAFGEEIQSNDNDDFVMLGGLFDYSETWLPESLPAL